MLVLEEEGMWFDFFPPPSDLFDQSTQDTEGKQASLRSNSVKRLRRK